MNTKEFEEFLIKYEVPIPNNDQDSFIGETLDGIVDGDNYQIHIYSNGSCLCLKAVEEWGIYEVNSFSLPRIDQQPFLYDMRYKFPDALSAYSFFEKENDKKRSDEHDYKIYLSLKNKFERR